MKKFDLSLIRCHCSKEAAAAGSLDNVLKEQIVPEIIDNCPRQILGVKYKTTSANLGNLVKPRDAREEPTFSYEAEPNQLYTIIMIDPDSPSRQDARLRNVGHFIKNNIPANNTKEGEVAIEYVQPCPFSNTGKHRIIFLLYKQAEGNQIEFEETVLKNQLRGRGPLDLKNYLTENNLNDPVAINFFYSEFDASVKETVSTFTYFG